jgi:hypothetical protein
MRTISKEKLRAEIKRRNVYYTHERSRDTISRLFATLMTSFPDYPETHNNRRKYWMKYDRKEYRRYLNAIKANGLGTINFESPSGQDCNFRDEPWKFILP